MDNVVLKIKEVVKNCGDMLLSVKEESLDIVKKEGPANIVTKYDKMIQKILKEELLKIVPDAVFIGEEDAKHTKVLENGYTFIVDPIDGTTNFAKLMPPYAVSVGLLKDKKPYIGVLYNPVTKEMFEAKKGCGAFLNGEPIKVSEKKLCEGMVLLESTSYYPELKKGMLEILTKLCMNSADYRVLGSSAVALCYLAAGRAEVFANLRLQPWDYAAAAIILEEAGGEIETVEGDYVSFDGPSTVFASNKAEDYRKYIK